MSGMTRPELVPTGDESTVEGFGPKVPAVAHDEALFAATLLSHAEPSRIGERAILGELTAGRPALISRLHPYFQQPRTSAEATPLGDRRLSRDPLRLERDGQGLRLFRDHQSQSLELNGEPVGEQVLISKEDLAAGAVLEIGGRVALLLHLVEREKAPAKNHGILGESDAIERLRHRIDAAGPAPWPVLIRGETGSGKELVAQALHRASRRQGSFLAVSLAALPPSLAAAELFGARRGAFTQAVDRRGLFVAAEGGTLFLDEIGEAPDELQTMLLRCLESREILPMGSEKVIKIDVRTIAATDAPLEAAVEAGRFRAALLHRLAGLTLEVPPLRARREDIPRLFLHFVQQELRQLGKEPPPGGGEELFLPPNLASRITRHVWPGNVRELRNFARQCVIDWQGGPLEGKIARTGYSPAPQAAVAAASVSSGLPTVLPKAASRRPNEVEREEVAAALRAHRFEIKAAAKALGLSRSSLYDLLDRFGLSSAARLDAGRIQETLTACGGDTAAAARSLGVSERALRRRLFLDDSTEGASG